MNRRRHIVAAGAAALALPRAARAQRPALPVIGYLSGVSRAESEDRLAAFRRGLGQAGYSEGRNVAIEFRFAEGDYTRLPALATELLRLPVNLIVAVGGSRPAQAAKAATSSVPIVFIHGGDPVKLGLVKA